MSRWGDLVVEGDARRRELLARHGNGIAGVEVREGGRRLLVYFLEHAPGDLHPGNVRIDPPAGGRPVRARSVRRAEEDDRELEDRLIVELDHPGSAGLYLLRVVDRRPDGTPGERAHRGIDPRFDGARFRFDVDAPRPPGARPPAGAPGHDSSVSYIYRDYAGLRRLMLDRLAVTMPEWVEQHEPDLLIALIELLAYVGDDLSYYEDAVATEAYLQTARLRVSVRRHARLVDYRLHEGANARGWVCVNVTAPLTLELGNVRFAAAGDRIATDSPVIDAATFSRDTLASFQQYSPVGSAPGRAIELPRAARLMPAHNGIALWSWGERDSHLAAGATSAVLRDGEGGSARAGSGGSRSRRPRRRRELELRVGDVLVLEETADPLTDGVGPADPSHRQAVRLTEVRRLDDPLYEQPLIEVRWSAEDALTFDLAVTAAGNPCSQASGNVLLVANGVPAQDTLTGMLRLTRSGLGFSTPFPVAADAGRHQARALRGLYAVWRRDIEEWRAEALKGTPLSDRRLELLRGWVGEEELSRLGLARERSERGDAEGDARALAELLARAEELLAGRRRRLEILAAVAESSGPLDNVLLDELRADWGDELTVALSAGRPGSWGPAAHATVQDPRAALPVLSLADAAGETWSPAPDLIDTPADARAFVAEIDDEGIASLRLGGPPPELPVTASYWVGNGSAGNCELEAINALVWASGGAAPGQVSLVRNPLPVTGGINSENTNAAKLAIPGAFREGQPRALSPQDYATLAGGVTGVRSAAAQPRFTGSLPLVEVAIQPALGEDPSAELLASVRHTLEAARRVGQLVEVVAPRYRPLVVAIDVTLAATAIRHQVAGELARLLSSGWLRDGTAALFNPSQLGFGKAVYSSPIVAAVHGVEGVESVTLRRFGFLERPTPPVSTQLTFGTLEIGRLDNDPTRPEHGYALVSMRGGQ